MIRIVCLDGWVLESDFRKPANDDEISMPCPVCGFDADDPEPIYAWQGEGEREHSVTEEWLKQYSERMWMQWKQEAMA